MKKLISRFLLAMSLVCIIPLTIDAATLTFEWKQDLVVGNTIFEGWAIFYGIQASGPYQQLGPMLVWDGTIKPQYSGSWSITAPANAETRYYFVARAKNKETAGGQWSGDSNQVTTFIDLKAPSVPVVTTLIPPFLPVGTFVIDGTKEAWASIWVNGTERIVADSSTAWTTTLVVVKGMNTYSITSKDAAPWLNESAALSLSFQGTEAPVIPIELKVTIIPE